ncbi:RNA-directed DNA polymerase from mobile element jockey [Gonioctena quinquepunctata]|nr:RNA-directed DNA polymerase from mobile element jockey [Gonioctena quinquepunctata]
MRRQASEQIDAHWTTWLLYTQISHKLLKVKILAVSLEIDSAFDTIRKNSIFEKLPDFNLTGNILSFQENFSTYISFKVVTNGRTSTSHVLENEVPQSSFLSTTLFPMSINDICSSIIPPVKYVLYADDFILYCQGKVTASTCTLLQKALDSIHNWALKYGFRSSTTKSNVIQVSKRLNPLLPQLSLNGDPLQVIGQHKFLGVLFDKRFTCRQHI